MNKPTPAESKKIMIVALMLVFLLAGIVIVRGRRVTPNVQPKVPPAAIPTSSVSGQPGMMGFDPSNVKIKLGEKIDLTVFIGANNNLVDGADSIIRYDPAQLEVTGIFPATYFKNYPLQKIDSKSGTLKVMGFELTNKAPLSAKVPFFKITLQAKKTGMAKVTINFQKGRTNLSTLVESGTSRNILGSVVQAEINIVSAK